MRFRVVLEEDEPVGMRLSGRRTGTVVAYLIEVVHSLDTTVLKPVELGHALRQASNIR
jgi:hypothetical protein